MLKTSLLLAFYCSPESLTAVRGIAFYSSVIFMFLDGFGVDFSLRLFWRSYRLQTEEILRIFRRFLCLI